MQTKFRQIKSLFLLKAKFLTASIVATGFDYALWLLLKSTFFGPVAAHAISYPLAVLLNFLLQKQYIFKMRRKPSTAFAIAMLFSASGWGLGTAMLYLLVKISSFAQTPVYAKLLVTFVLFFYNFFLKRFAFEKRFFFVE